MSSPSLQPPQPKPPKKRAEAHAALLAGVGAQPRDGEHQPLPDGSPARRKRGAGRKIPAELVDDMIVGTDTAALFCGYSTKHFRDLVSQGEAPPPIRFSARRLGWRVRDLKAWVAAKEAAA